jgi:hypothetical protein
MMLILLCDQATKYDLSSTTKPSQNDKNRSYFMMELFYTLGTYILGI